jgi:hypothetical protein
MEVINTDKPEFTFKKPIYTKKPNASGGFDPCYVFPIDTTDGLSTELNFSLTDNNIIQSIHTTIQNDLDWWFCYLNSFLEGSKSYFTKPYTAQILHKYVQHNINMNEIDTTTDGIEILYRPLQITVCNGKFIQEWSATIIPISIDLNLNTIPMEDTDTNINTQQESIEGSISPDENHELEQEPVQAHTDNKINDITASTPTSTELENIDDLPTNFATDDTNIIDLDAPFTKKTLSRQYDIQKVKEARMKAKIAQFKAERLYAKFIDKYGDTCSSFDSDSDRSYTSDIESNV